MKDKIDFFGKEDKISLIITITVIMIFYFLGMEFFDNNLLIKSSFALIGLVFGILLAYLFNMIRAKTKLK